MGLCGWLGLLALFWWGGFLALEAAALRWLWVACCPGLRVT